MPHQKSALIITQFRHNKIEEHKMWFINYFSSLLFCYHVKKNKLEERN